MFKKANVDMLSGSIFKGLLQMSIPIMIMNVMQTIFNFIDMLILGRFASDAAVGAVGTCSTLITLCTGLLIGVSTGANVIVAKSIGADDKEHTDRTIGTAILFSVVGGIALLIIGVFFAEIFLKWINCPDSLLEQASLYFRLYFWGVPFLLLYNFSASILRAGGDTKRPMCFLLLGGFVKVVLDFILITAFDMSVDGVGIATIISDVIIGGLTFYALLKNKGEIEFKANKLRFYASELKAMLFIGIPTGLEAAMYSLANSVIAAAVNNFGADATTGVSVANQFDGILYNICVATSYATIPYVAQNIAAGNLKRTKKAIINSVILTVIFGAGLGMLSAFFSRELSSLMSSTPAVIEYSHQKMVVVSSTYFICGIYFVMSGTLKGMGKPVVPTVATFMFMCVLRFIWVYAIFPLYPSLAFLYLVWPVGWICCIVVELITYFIEMHRIEVKL